jgi:hypothetical protein
MDVGKEVLSIKRSFWFIKVFSQIMFWESDASGTGGKVPGRYGGKSGISVLAI